VDTDLAAAGMVQEGKAAEEHKAVAASLVDLDHKAMDHSAD
jgi:hypothetical protein